MNKWIYIKEKEDLINVSHISHVYKEDMDKTLSKKPFRIFLMSINKNLFFYEYSDSQQRCDKFREIVDFVRSGDEDDTLLVM